MVLTLDAIKSHHGSIFMCQGHVLISIRPVIRISSVVLKAILFRNPSHRMYRLDCEASSIDKFNFDLDRVGSCDFCRMPWSETRASDRCLGCSRML